MQLERVADRNEWGEGVVCKVVEAVEVRVGEGGQALLGLAIRSGICCTMVGSMRHRTSHTEGACLDNGCAMRVSRVEKG